MRYRKKPVVIEAMKFTGLNNWEILGFLGVSSKSEAFLNLGAPNGLYIPTLEGNLLATPGDWIIKGVKGEFYPCKPDVFEMSYEAAE